MEGHTVCMQVRVAEQLSTGRKVAVKTLNQKITNKMINSIGVEERGAVRNQHICF